MHSAMRGRMLILEGSYAESFKPGSSVTLLILHFIEYFSRKQSIQFRNRAVDICNSSQEFLG